MPANGQTNGQLIVQESGGRTGFPVQSFIAAQAGYPASGPLKGAVVPYWFTGVGVPSVLYPTQTFPYGTMFTNTTAPLPTGTYTLYVYKPVTTGTVTAGVWTALL